MPGTGFCSNPRSPIRMVDTGIPLVSVLLPVRNGMPWLAECLDSLAAQQFPSFEIIAVDDGSTDDTPAYLQHRSRTMAGLRVFHQAAGGLVAGLSHGLSRCRGGFIARMDADDRCLPGRLAYQVEWLEKHPGTGLVSCLVVHGGEAHQGGYARHVAWLNSLRTAGQIRNGRFVDAPVAHPSVMFRRTLCDRHGAWRDGDFPEDYELWLRWLDEGVVMEKVSRELLYWRDPPTRLSRVDSRYRTDAFNRLKIPWLRRELERVQGDRPLISWGSGRESRKRIEGLEVDGWLDVDVRRVGQRIRGRVVRHRDSLQAGEAFVLANVGRVGARAEIEERLEGLGYRAGSDTLSLA